MSILMNEIILLHHIIKQLQMGDWIVIIGAIAAFLAAYFAWKSTRLMEEQLKLSKREKYPESEGEIAKIGFLITDLDRFELTYVNRDEKEHLVKELILPADNEVPIIIWLRPGGNYTVEDRYFGCEGDLKNKPEPVSCFNPFVLRGIRREVTLEENSDHYIDHHKYYHITRRQEFTKEEVYLGGYKIKTHGEGDFEVKYIIRTPNTVKEHELKIKVRKESKEKMKCTLHENCCIEPIIQN